jgi:hypothetical protein
MIPLGFTQQLRSAGDLFNCTDFARLGRAVPASFRHEMHFGSTSVNEATPRHINDFSVLLVGATGIEPVTPPV